MSPAISKAGIIQDALFFQPKAKVGIYGYDETIKPFDRLRRVFPTIRKISFRVGTGRAFDSTFPWFRGINTCSIMAMSCTFEHLDVSEDTNSSEELMVSVLNNIRAP